MCFVGCPHQHVHRQYLEHDAHSASILMDPSRALAMLATREMEWHVRIKTNAWICSTITATSWARLASTPSAALDAEHLQQHLHQMVQLYWLRSKQIIIQARPGGMCPWATKWSTMYRRGPTNVISQRNAHWFFLWIVEITSSLWLTFVEMECSMASTISEFSMAMWSSILATQANPSLISMAMSTLLTLSSHRWCATIQQA